MSKTGGAMDFLLKLLKIKNRYGYTAPVRYWNQYLLIKRIIGDSSEFPNTVQYGVHKWASLTENLTG
jgi:hypothetical protein